jgi:poly-gamma-glutamate synthesis protein (capsule biosynthesis protein)
MIRFYTFFLFLICIPVLLLSLITFILQITSQARETDISLQPVVSLAASTQGVIPVSSKETTEVPGEIIFVGDVMLARNVELLMHAYGSTYPFLNTRAIFGTTSAVIANFEASIPTTHMPTPPSVMRFSVSSSLLGGFSQSGITHVSLANNHALDYGEDAYSNTRIVLEKNGIAPFGHSNVLSTTSLTYITVGQYTIGIIGIHTLFSPPAVSVLKALMAELTTTSDIQIAYVHWGEEYHVIHNASQQKLATQLVALGIDAIIGHHPHVVQDVQVIAGVPVFYSLGNFIFDQYFSTPVQVGYALSLQLLADSISYTFVPVTSLGNRSQPRLMVGTEKMVFLDDLATRSDILLRQDIKENKLILPYLLATSSKDVTIEK